MSRSRGSIYDRFEKHADKTFALAATRYLSEYQGKDKTRAAQSIWSVEPYIGHLRLIDVDDEALAQFKEDRRLGVGHFADDDGKPRPAMAGTINKDLTQVVTILNKAARVWRWIPMAPKLEHVMGPARVAYPLTWEEQDKLFRFLPTGFDVGLALFALNTGCRRQEMFGLKWSDRQWMPELDIKNADGSVRERMYVFILRDTKNGHQRAVVCNSIARRAVAMQQDWQEVHGKSDYVFPSRKGENVGSRVRQGGKTWEIAWRAAKLPYNRMVKRGIHNARHTFAHRLRAAGVPEEDRNALLGHANTNLAQHYASADIARLLEHSEKVTVRKETTLLRAIG
jgi:integrase